MSFRRHLHRRRHNEVEKTSKYNDEFDDLSAITFKDCEDSVSAMDALTDTVSGQKEADSISVGSRDSFTCMDEKSVFEHQLNQLQDQLVSVMIENQNMSSELKVLKSNELTQRLMTELDKEKEKNKMLEKELRSKFHHKPSVDHAPSHAFVDQPQLSQSSGNIATESISPSNRPISRLSLYERWKDRAIERLYDIMEEWADLTQPEQEKPDVVTPLSVKVLKENLKRFRTAAKPYKSIVTGLHNLIVWKSPSYTFCVFMLYLYVVYCGWLLPCVFFLAALRMAVSYLNNKNIHIPVSYLDPGDESQESEDVLKLSDKFNLVLAVATKVQNGLGALADSMEKIINLFSWRHYKGARRIFLMLCVGFIVTAFVPMTYFWRFAGVMFGIKLFIVNCVYSRYPRMKKRFDSSHRLWLELPTNKQFNKQCVQDELEKYVIVSHGSDEPIAVAEAAEPNTVEIEDGTDVNSAFRARFSLPSSENPLPGWERGKRAILFGRDRSLFNLLAHKRGKFYLTKSFLCFERDKNPSKKNVLIPICDISDIKRTKIFQNNPGRGMALQIVIRANVEKREKTLTFGGLIGRDDMVSDVQRAMLRVQREATSAGHQDRGARPQPSQICTFTMAAHYEDSDVE